MALRVTNGFLGFRLQGNLSYIDHDNEELFLKNLKDKPNDWYYRDKEITYSYNNLGHRSKNIEDVDLDNYILFTGCSHTEGVGLELDKTYSNIVATELKCDYYNLALGGSGIDTVMHNLNVWLHTIKKQPKHIIFQWPDPSRFLAYENDAFHIHGLWEKDPNILNFILAGDANYYFTARYQLAKILIESMNNVTLVNLATNNNEVHFKRYDFARDGLHFGIESNRILADILLEKIQQIEKIG